MLDTVVKKHTFIVKLNKQEGRQREQKSHEKSSIVQIILAIQFFRRELSLTQMLYISYFVRQKNMSCKHQEFYS